MDQEKMREILSNIPPDQFEQTICDICGCPIFSPTYTILKIKTPVFYGLPLNACYPVATQQFVCVNCKAAHGITKEELMKAQSEMTKQMEAISNTIKTTDLKDEENDNNLNDESKTNELNSEIKLNDSTVNKEFDDLMKEIGEKQEVDIIPSNIYKYPSNPNKR